MSKVKTRQRKPKSEEAKQLKKIRDKHLSNHVLEVELVVSENQRRFLLSTMEDLRMIRNTLVGELMKIYKQMIRTKRFKTVQKDLILISNQLKSLNKKSKDFKTKEKDLKAKQKALYDEKESMLKEFEVTFDFIRKMGEKLNQNKYQKPDAVTTWSISDNIWSGMEKILYSDGKKLSFYEKGKFPTLQGKQAERCIILKYNDELNPQKNKPLGWYVSFQKNDFPFKIKANDLFVEETLSHILKYMEEGQAIDERNVQAFLKEQPLTDTYRVCNNRMVHKQIRGKDRFYLQITLEGKAVPKRKKDGTYRHKKGIGRIGVDLGMSTIAYMTDQEIGLQDLAERTTKRTLKNERKLKQLQRKANWSRYKNNLNNYKYDGTIKRGIRLEWKQSNRYKKLMLEVKELHRKNAASRKYAIHELTNHLRSLGDEVVIEPMNFKGLQKKSKEVTKNKKGKFNTRKRYGKSLLNRNPGYLKECLKKKFNYKEVDIWNYKASQYDHKNGVFEKKKLSKRMHQFDDGTTVQRDLYAAFLLRCTDEDLKQINQLLCDEYFDSFKKLHDEFVWYVQHHKIKLLNSGIKIK